MDVLSSSWAEIPDSQPVRTGYDSELRTVCSSGVGQLFAPSLLSSNDHSLYAIVRTVKAGKEPSYENEKGDNKK